ncbi:MAG: hypothetical protein M1816_006346 [Peltula sp. TS41687]|nr:MAG: hypothetical protein M1816_006346 [Peltula sp. TS41687]
MDGGRSIFSASPPDHAYLSSPTNSLIAFASVAVGDYGFAKSGNPRAAEATVDNARALSSSVGSRLGDPALVSRGTSGLFFDPARTGDRGPSDRPPTERMAPLHTTFLPDSSPAMFCISPRSQFSESFERTHCQGGYNCVQAGLETGNAASPTGSNQSVEIGSADEIGATNGYSYPAPSLSHFSPPQQGNAPLPQVFTFQTRIPTASSQLPPPGVVTDICTKKTGPQCSYTSNCSTGSPLRKVVSHIFGRNKLCTRQIPKGVWVHYCRKHYQRSRYRNPRGFALLQCDLVRKQIRRLQDWGGVMDWMIKVRKREEERLSKENAEMLAADNSSVGHGRGANKTKAMEGNANGTIPSSSMAGAWGWLVQSTGSGKSTVDVLKILDRIEGDIASSGSSFPDVEILPVVITTATTDSSKSDEASSPDLGVGWGKLSPGSGTGLPQQRSTLNEESHKATIESQTSTPRKRRNPTKSTAPTNSSSQEDTETLRPVLTTTTTTERRQTKRARVSPATPTRTTRAGVSDSEVMINGSTTDRSRSARGMGFPAGHLPVDDGDEISTLEFNTARPTTVISRRSLRRSTRTARPFSVT